MENLYSCRKCALFALCVWLVFLSTEADTHLLRYTGPHSVENGQPFEVTCRVSEFDPIKWTLDRGAVPAEGETSWRLIGPGQVVSILRVAAAQPAHSGEYRCSSYLPGPGHNISISFVTNVQVNFEYEQGSSKYITFEYRLPLELKCNATVSQDEKVKFSWLKDGKEWTPVATEGSRSDTKDTSAVSITYAVDKDAAEYSCVVSKGNAVADTANVTAILKPFVKLPPHTNVVEGEKLILTCIVHGSPVPRISWQIAKNATYTKSDGVVNILEFKDKEKGDSAAIPNGILQINEATMENRDTYTCIGITTIGGKTFNSSSDTFVRVKDKMAALWPFLGICLEVVVLCTVILIYEKKRNKTEMDESDTDGSPEQKNTPDHGKDSEVRHRK